MEEESEEDSEEQSEEQEEEEESEEVKVEEKEEENEDDDEMEDEDEEEQREEEWEKEEDMYQHQMSLHMLNSKLVIQLNDVDETHMDYNKVLDYVKKDKDLWTLLEQLDVYDYDSDDYDE